MDKDLECFYKYKRRKSKNVHPNKVMRVTLRMTTDEYDYIKEMACRACRTISAYIRETSLGKTLHEKPQDEFMEALWKLDRTETNLNQIAKMANTFKYVNEKELQDVMNTLNGFITELRARYLN